MPSAPSDDPNSLASLLGVPVSSVMFEKIFLAIGFAYRTKSKDGDQFRLQKNKIEAWCLVDKGDHNIFYNYSRYNGRNRVVGIGIGRKEGNFPNNSSKLSSFKWPECGDCVVEARRVFVSDPAIKGI